MISFNHVLKFCKEDISLIENYKQATEDKIQYWDCHHRLETDLNVSQQYLVDNDLYYNRPASELIFLTISDHASLHNKGRIPWNKGKKLPQKSEETRKKMSEAFKGRKYSEETRKKMSEAAKRRWKK